MTNKRQFALAVITAPDLKIARKLVKAALQARLVACANLLPRIESHYWWEGHIQTSSEILILLKTTTARLSALEKLIIDQHPYDTPEFIVLKIDSGNKRYLDWWRASVA